eukprot:2324805-Alexandrium_andersonii.AAC.1
MERRASKPGTWGYRRDGSAVGDADFLRYVGAKPSSKGARHHLTLAIRPKDVQNNGKRSNKKLSLIHISEPTRLALI